MGGGQGRFHVQLTYPRGTEPCNLLLTDPSRSSDTEELIVGERHHAQVLRRAWGAWGLRKQVSPGVVGVRVAPVFALAVQCSRTSSVAGILGRDQAVERVVTKSTELTGFEEFFSS